MAEKWVTQIECEERRKKIEKDYNDLADRVSKHGGEIDDLRLFDVKENERLKRIEDIFSLISKITISVVAAIVLLIIKGALKI